nr:heavy metal-associated isoprenylated plant protein 6-like [Ipomoea batatas]
MAAAAPSRKKQPTTTFVLKVGIHCDGCARDIKKNVEKMEGVDTVKVNSEQQTAVITGTLHPDKVIAMLYKKFKKKAELLPKKPAIKLPQPSQVVVPRNPGKVCSQVGQSWGANNLLSDPYKAAQFVREVSRIPGLSVLETYPRIGMSLSLVAPTTFALKLKIHCNGCEKKLKQMLLKVQGVHSVRVDAKQGHVLITGTVDPPTILTMLEKLGRKAELLWEQGSPASPRDRGKDVEIVTRSLKGIKPLMSYQDIMENPGQLSEIPGLQTVEVSSTIKFNFKNGSVTEISSTRDDAKPLVLPPPSPGHHGCCFHGNGYFESMNSHNNCCHWQSPGVAFGRNVSPPGPAPPWQFGFPSAPPVPSDYEPSAPSPPPQPPPVRANTYPSMFSDENPNSCTIM